MLARPSGHSPISVTIPTDRTRSNSAAHSVKASSHGGKVTRQQRIVDAQPDYGPALCVLGLIDAGLGRKDDALREGRRAVELTPPSKDSINGPLIMGFFAVMCAWVEEKDLAIDQLTHAIQLPGRLSYGQLRLHPIWDPLRGDPRFEKIVASLAPKQVHE